MREEWVRGRGAVNEGADGEIGVGERGWGREKWAGLPVHLVDE